PGSRSRRWCSRRSPDARPTGVVRPNPSCGSASSSSPAPCFAGSLRRCRCWLSPASFREPARGEPTPWPWPRSPGSIRSPAAPGVAALVSGLSLLTWLSLPLVAVGVWLTWSALGHILPAGSLRARPGAPAAITMIFLLILAFIGADYFIPLMLTGVRGRSLAEASVVITLGTVSWSIGNWWQSHAVVRTSSVTLVRLGGAMLTIAIIGIMATLAGAPLAISYLAWFAAGVGMGIAYPTAYLVIMQGAAAADAGAAVSSEQVAERLALALGGGLGGVCVALALALHASLTTGLAGAFGLALLAAVASVTLAPRLRPAGRPGAGPRFWISVSR